MGTENNIIKLARELGEALKNSPEYTAFCETRDIMKKNKALKEKLDEFKIQKSVLEVEKEKENPDEHVIDVVSSRLEVLYGEITKDPEMAAYTKAEEDLNILMTAINMTISSYVGAQDYANDGDAEQDGGCTHDCSRCKGCH